MDKTSAARKQDYASRQIRLEIMLRDLEVSHLAFRVASFVATFVNADKGCAWPSQALIANRLGISIKSVYKATQELEDRGHIRIEHQRGRGQTNKIFFVAATKDDLVRTKEMGRYVSSSAKGRNDGRGNPEPKSGSRVPILSPARSLQSRTAQLIKSELFDP